MTRCRILRVTVGGGPRGHERHALEEFARLGLQHHVVEMLANDLGEFVHGRALVARVLGEPRRDGDRLTHH